jgi:taurine dioxygenase
MTRRETSTLSLVSTGAAVGAVVQGFDASVAPRPGDVLALRRGLEDHGILIFKKQDLSEEAFTTFATSFGHIFYPPSDVPVLASDEGGKTPAIVRVSNVDGGYTGTGELSAHADHRWTPYPSASSFLYALEVPSRGGDTTWYNMALAYETLDQATKDEIAEVQLITYNPFLFQPGDTRPRYRDPNKPLISPVHPHPLVQTHLQSGKKLLALDWATEVEVVGRSVEDGKALVERLREHFHQPRFRYTHRWEVGDVVWWDNRATTHARTAFDPAERRVLKRISLAGGRPF